MDQLGLRQLLRAPRRGPEQLGRTDRHQPFIEQLDPAPIGRKAAIAEQDRAVERLAVEVHGVQVHPGTGQLHAVLRVGHLEAFQRGEQPAHGQRRGRLETQRAALSGNRDAGILDGPKPDPQLLRQQTTGIGQEQPRTVAFEQLAAEVLFQRLHMPTDRALRDEQALRRLGEGAETRRRLEGPQGIERRHAQRFSRSVMHDFYSCFLLVFSVFHHIRRRQYCASTRLTANTGPPPVIAQQQ